MCWSLDLGVSLSTRAGCGRSASRICDALLQLSADADRLGVQTSLFLEMRVAFIT
jgi:hypothetical protein